MTDEISILDPAHPDLVAMYTMDNISADGKTLFDETGLHNCVLSQAQEGPGVKGLALSFPTAESYAYMGDLSQALGDKVSVSFYIDLPTPEPGQGLVFFSGTAASTAGGDTAPKFNMAFSESNGSWIITLWRHTFSPSYKYIKAVSNIRFPAGITQVSINIDDTNTAYTAEAYVNNKKTAFTYTSNGSPGIRLRNMPYFELGRERATKTGNSTAFIDHFRLFRRLVTAAEAEALCFEAFAYKINGSLLLDGSPLQTPVRLYSAAGTLIDSLTTDVNGFYQKYLPTNEVVTVVPEPPTGHTPQIARVTPAPRNR